MPLIDHPEGGYRFLPGIAPYSGGVVGAPGFEIAQTAIDIYTVHSIKGLLPEVVLGRTKAANQHGVRWYFSRPPIEGIEYEMDLRGVRTELRIG
jgi:hypothetical protein